MIGGDICAAPLYAAYHQGFFDDAGLKVTLARTQQTEDTKDGVGAGKYIGAPGIFFSWLEPIYNGLNARLTAGRPTPAACAWWCARTRRIRSWQT